jgi:titin
LANGGFGIDLRAPQTTIGGAATGAGNLISGNQTGGIQLTGTDAHDNLLQGNRIGTNAAGTAAIFNRGLGVSLAGAANNVLGGGMSGAGNLISGNGTHGVQIAGANATGNVLLGNRIGTNQTGTVAIPNASQGVYITSGNNRVGGTGVGEGNVISGNLSSGVYLNTAGATGNVVQNNRIGTDATGTAALGNARYGIDLRGPGNSIGGPGVNAGNVISGNGVDGVFVSGASGNDVQGNVIGTNLSGTLDVGNGARGLAIYAANTTIRGNVISGNDLQGLFIAGPSSTDNVVRGNRIGTDRLGQIGLGNGNFGVYVASPNNTIGGTGEGQGNVISGNSGGGIYLVGSSASGNLVQGNRIGTDAAGTAVLGNAAFGIDVRGPNNTIGGVATGAGNLLSGNVGGGIQLTSTNAYSNVLQGNLIGTDATGRLDRGNQGPGVSIAIASRNTVGGATAAARNVISGNDHYGVQIAGTSTNQNVIVGNYIGTRDGRRGVGQFAIRRVPVGGE